jgi:hypothetical protein
MRLLGCLTFAYWLFGLVHCLIDVKPAQGTTVLEVAAPDEPQKTVWHKAIDASGPIDFRRLYTEASKAFNWVKTQPQPFTQNHYLLIAAFYDHKANKIFLSTILRGEYLKTVNKNAKNLAPVWSKARQKAPAGDAEDGAFYYREASFGPKIRAGFNYGDPVTGKPAGSMIVAWGAPGINANTVRHAKGKPFPLCGFCRPLSYALGVDFDGANPAEFGKNSPRPDPNVQRPKSAPPSLGRPGSPPNRPNSPAPNRPFSAPPHRPNSPPPKSAPISRIPRPVKTPPGSSPGSSYGGSFLNDVSPDQLNNAFGAKRPATSPPGSGQRKPKGPTSTPPSRIPLPLRPSPNSGSPSKKTKRTLSRSPGRRRLRRLSARV